LLFEVLTEWKRLGWIDFEVGASTSAEIDVFGIKKANNLAMQRAIDGLISRQNTWKKDEYLRVCIDGNDHYSLEITECDTIYTNTKQSINTD
jgi:ribonuclease HII